MDNALLTVRDSVIKRSAATLLHLGWQIRVSVETAAFVGLQTGGK